MEKLKLKVKKGLFVICFALLFGILVGSVASASSSDYWFEMNNRSVNGADNGIYHSLEAGDITIEGAHYVYSIDGGALDEPYPIYYSLARERLGIDKECGSKSFSIDTDPNGVFATADQDSDKYYLVVFTVNDDGHNTRGSGTISN